MTERFTALDSSLAVGSAPLGPEAIELLIDRGVSGLVSLQTDEDLAARGLSWSVLWQLYTARGIHAARVPIVDFDKRSLQRGLDDAVAAIARQVDEGRLVYVHCTAGLNRSPSAVIAFLVRHRGLSVAAATTWLLERHDAEPYPDVLKRWAKRAKLPLSG